MNSNHNDTAISRCEMDRELAKTNITDDEEHEFCDEYDHEEQEIEE